jgi:hypothetical protein
MATVTTSIKFVSARTNILLHFFGSDKNRPSVIGLNTNDDVRVDDQPLLLP